MKRVMRAALAMAALVGAAGVANRAEAADAIASSVGPDMVVLKDGSMMRGTLTEMIKNDHATLLLSGGQSARIRWDAIQRIEKTNDASAPVTVAPPSDAQALPPKDETVVVHIDAPRPVELEMANEGDPRHLTWTSVCQSPCDKALPIDRAYRIAGDGVRSSRPVSFRGEAAGSHVYLNANVATKGGFVGGIVLTSIGTATIGVGALLVLVSYHGGSSPSGYSFSKTQDPGLQAAGLITMGAGVAMLVPGIVMTVKHASTKVNQSKTPPASPGKSAVLDSFGRDPVWASPATITLPSAFGAPLLSGTF